MKYIDITIDFETCGLSANAAPMQIAAVAWDRDAESWEKARLKTFSQCIDLRSCIDLGMEFDPETITWWAERKEDVRSSVLYGSCVTLDRAMSEFFSFVRDFYASYNDVKICLWAQGSDFDIPILRNIARKLTTRFYGAD